MINVNYNKHHVNKIKNLKEKNVKCLIILRGCSGSGKSTLARYIPIRINFKNLLPKFCLKLNL
jgi:adenylylsulfate kinase-like enzyme